MMTIVYGMILRLLTFPWDKHSRQCPFPFPIQTFLQYPHMASAQANRNYIISSMVESLGAIAELVDGKDPTTIPFLLTVEDGSCRLFQHFNEFEVNWLELKIISSLLCTLYSPTTDIVTCCSHFFTSEATGFYHKSRAFRASYQLGPAPESPTESPF